MLESQFEIDGYRFGRDLPIEVKPDEGGVEAQVGDPTCPAKTAPFSDVTPKRAWRSRSSCQ